MTTISYTSPVDLSSDATFRVWGGEFNSKLIAAGLVQTSDTGQINWTTATRAAGGYEIYRFNDSLQATAPIFIKLAYSVGGITPPKITVSIGTGTNGGGTLTGITTTPTNASYSTPPTGITAFPSFICVNEGFLGVVHKVGAAGAGSPYANTFFAISRSCDSNGTPTATGAILYTHSAAGGTPAACAFARSIRFASPNAGARLSTKSFCLVYGSVTDSSLNDGTKQRYLHFMDIPDVLPVFSIFTVLVAEVPQSNFFTATIVGTTPRTYLSIGLAGGTGDCSNSTNYGLAMLWE